MTDSTNLIRIIQAVQPDEIYNLAAQSHVQVSFETPEYTANADATGALRILEAMRILGLKEKTRYYQASTSELYGNGLIPDFRTESSTIFVFRKVRNDVEEPAHGSADDRGGQVDGSGPQG